MSLSDARRILEVQSPYKVPDAKKDIDGELYEEVDLGKGDSDFSGAKHITSPEVASSVGDVRALAATKSFCSKPSRPSFPHVRAFLWS